MVGKLASLCAIALTFGAYVAPGAERALAVALVVAMTAVNALGVTKTAALTKAIVAVTLAALAFVVIAPSPAAMRTPDASRRWSRTASARSTCSSRRRSCSSRSPATPASRPG